MTGATPNGSVPGFVSDFAIRYFNIGDVASWDVQPNGPVESFSIRVNSNDSINQVLQLKIPEVSWETTIVVVTVNGIWQNIPIPYSGPLLSSSFTLSLSKFDKDGIPLRGDLVVVNFSS